MDDGVFVFQKVKPRIDFIEEVLTCDVRKLEQMDSSIISQYTLALSQYSIYFKSQSNQTKAEIFHKQRIIETTTSQLITKDVLKEYKTKKDASVYIISSTEELSLIEENMSELKEQLMLLDGIDKTISEYIACFKRELTRRADERWQTDKERR